MKNFYAITFTFFTLALSPLAEAQVGNVGSKVKPDSIYLSGYTIANQKKDNEYLKSQTSENNIPSPNLPQISGNNSQRAIEIKAQEKRLQAALNAERNKYQLDTDKKNKEISMLRDQLRKATQGLSTENTQTKILNDQIAKLKQQLNSSKTKSDLQQKKQIEQLDRLTRERTMLATAPLKKDIDRLTQDKARHEAELNSIVGIHKRLLTSHKKIMEERDELLENLNLDRLALEKANADLLKAKQNGHKVVEGLREQIKVQAAQIQAQAEQLAAKDKQNAQLIQQLAHSAEINKELSHHLASVTLERDKLSELIDLSDADRTKKTIKEALRLGEELRNAREAIKQLQVNQNAAQDEIIIAENKLAVAKQKIIDLQSVNTSYIRRIGSLENSLNATKEQLDDSVASGSTDPIQKQEVAMLKQALKRITTQLDRRKQAEDLLVAEYQKANIENAGLTNAIINLTANDVTLTARETKLLKDRVAITDSFSLSSKTITEEQRVIAKAKSKNQVEALETMARRFVDKKQQR